MERSCMKVAGVAAIDVIVCSRVLSSKEALVMKTITVTLQRHNITVTLQVTLQRHNTTAGTKAFFAELWLVIGLSFERGLIL